MKDNNGVAGSIIKGLRETAGISQTDLAKRTGISRSEISLYETGKRDPSVTRFMKLISALGYVMVINRKAY